MKNLKSFINPNLQFIWSDLMSKKGRRLSKLTLLTVLLGAALQTAAPYGVGLITASLTKSGVATLQKGVVNEVALRALITGIMVYLTIEITGSMVAVMRMKVREYLFQDNFWFIPQRLTERFLARPLGMLASEDSEIDGGGVESLKDKVWNIVGAHIFNIFPSYSLALFAMVACTLVYPLIGALATLYIVVDLMIGAKQNAYIHKEMKPIVAGFKRWERRIREWWHATPGIKNNGTELRVVGQVKDDIQETLVADDKVWRIFFPWSVFGRQIVGQVFAAGMFLLAGYLAIAGYIEVANAVLVFFSFNQIKVVLGNINDQQRDLGYQLAVVDRYRAVLTQSQPFRHNEGEMFKERDIGFAFENVSLSLGSGADRREILRDVSLTVRPGMRIGIVGPSGAGKSQLVGLLLRNMDPNSGVIKISGHDLRSLNLGSYLRFLGIIPQKSEPFEDSVEGNLMFALSGDDLARLKGGGDIDARLWDALRKAGLDLGNRLSNGLKTQIGHKGMRLSVGQQQRLAIAGAHLKISVAGEMGGCMVIADEPTASLDSESELAVMEHLTDSLADGTTVVMIAHRLSTVAGMDAILFVRPLETVLYGSPQVTMHASLSELYTSEPLFRRMADAQGFRP